MGRVRGILSLTASTQDTKEATTMVECCFCGEDVPDDARGFIIATCDYCRVEVFDTVEEFEEALAEEVFIRAEEAQKSG